MADWLFPTGESPKHTGIVQANGNTLMNEIVGPNVT